MTEQVMWLLACSICVQ